MWYHKIIMKYNLNRFIKSKLFLSLAVCVVLVGILFLARGWVRGTVMPKTATIIYGHTIQSTFDAQIKNLDDPLTKLGYSKITKTNATCILGTARSIHTEMYCYAKYEAYGTVPTIGHAKTILNTNAQTIQDAATSNGWSGGGRDNQLTKLVSSVTGNIDYNPDASYQKQFGATYCMFSSNTAFSHPKLAAMSSYISCTRTVDWFGKPNVVSPIF